MNVHVCESKSAHVNVSIHVPLSEQMCLGMFLERIPTHSDCFIYVRQHAIGLRIHLCAHGMCAPPVSLYLASKSAQPFNRVLACVPTPSLTLPHE